MSVTPEAPPSSELHELLTAVQPIWSGVKARRERSLVQTEHGLVYGDPALELDWQAHNKQMNDLLEEYYAEKLGAVALEGIEHEQIISEHAEMAAQDGKGSQ